MSRRRHVAAPDRSGRGRRARGSRSRVAAGRDPRARLRTRTFLLTALLATACALTAYALDQNRFIELDTIDARFAVRGTQPMPKDVAVVAIDDKTFDDLDLQWPYPRSIHADVIDRLGRDGAKVIAYDVQFTEATEAEEDGALLDAVARNRPMVLAASETDERGRSNVFGGERVVASVGARAGNTNFSPDDEETFRRMHHSVGGLETFAVASAEVATGQQVTDERFTEPDGQAWIDFAGPPGSVLTVPFSRVLRGEFRKGTFKDRIVVVGATAPTAQDLHPTSTTRDDDLMAGPEIQAHAIETVLRGMPLQSIPGWAKLLIVVLMSVAIPLLAMVLPFRVVLPAAVVGAITYLAGATLAFDAGAVLPVSVPLLGLIIATVGSTAGHALLSATERQRTRDLFARFVPAAVVDDVLAKADGDLRLGGQRKEGTVMFCDLRGFTSFAERLEPDRVIEVLNQYLSEMTEAIMEQEGTLVAFMGDGIMAVFGAPLDRVDHADRAVLAARSMIDERLPRFNAWLRGQGIDQTFRMGIGLNSGPVMSGNVGSSTRVEYTAIGDTTNTAARIEAMTKDEDAQVLLSEATRDAMRDLAGRADLQPVGERAVRGRDARITLWTLGRTSAG